MFSVGRIIAGWYAKKIKVRKLIYLNISLALFGVALLLADSSQIITILGVTLAGFAIAPIFPRLIPSTTSRVGFPASGQHNWNADCCSRFRGWLLFLQLQVCWQESLDLK